MPVDTNYSNPATAVGSGGLLQATDNVMDATYLNRIASDVYNLGGTAGHIGALAYNSANISIPDNAFTNLTFNSETYDADPNGEIHSTSSNTDRLTCRTAGKYLLVAVVRFAPNATGYRHLRIKNQGGQTLSEVILPNVGAAIDAGFVLTALMDMSATNYAVIDVYQNSGGALNVLSSSPTTPAFGMTKV